MCRFPRALLLPLLAGRAAAVRSKVQLAAELAAEAASNQTWLVKTLTWCSLQDEVLECDDDSVIKMKSAFYRRNKKPECMPAHSDSSVTCPPDALKLLQETCDERRRCSVPAKAHQVSCPGNPWTFIRVRYECVAGTPKAGGGSLGDGAKEADGTTAGPTPESGGGGTTSAEPKEAPQKPQPLTEVNTQEADREVEVLPRGRDEASSSTSTTSTLFVRGDQVVKAKVEEELAKSQQELAIQLCYRFSRMQRIRSMHPLTRLTTCANQDEGCFKVDFHDGRRYTDFEQEPEAEEFLSGYLVGGDDSWSLSFRGIGLQRNDYGTWGLCLPKKGGIEFAVSMFESLQARRAMLADAGKKL